MQGALSLTLSDASTAVVWVRSVEIEGTHTRSYQVQACMKSDCDRKGLKDMIPRHVYVKDAKSALELLKDSDWDRRRAIAEYLGKEKDPIATEPLCQVLKEDQVESVRYAAAAALGEIGDSRAFESLILALKDESSGVRWSAAEALGKLGDPRAVESLVASLTDKERWVRDRAAEALGIIGDIRAVPPLVEALTDEQSVIENAAGALGKLRDARAIEPLARLLEDRRKRVQQKAISALGEIGEPAVHVISQALNHKNRRVRRTEKEILDSLGSGNQH